MNPQQGALFGDDAPADGATDSARDAPPGPARPLPIPDDGTLAALASKLNSWHGPIRLGTSSWHFPGWRGLVYAGAHPASELSRNGLAAYSRHPLLGTVSLDRAFYRLLSEGDYAALAAQVPAGFRFVVKAPALLTDATLRDPATARATAPNPQFLDAELAVQRMLQPLARGLLAADGSRLGALVLQLSPLPQRWLDDPQALLERLGRLCHTLRHQRAWPSGAHLGVEVRDTVLMTPPLIDTLRAAGAVYVLGLHDRLPAIDEQLPLLRAQWPAPLITRWNLQRGLRYDAAKARFEPFDRLAEPDPATRAVLARVVAATAAAGQEVYVTINNKAEGSAPCSVRALAEAIVDQPVASRGG